MDDSSSPLTYHPVSMTINGVTKSVLVPLPKSRLHGRPVTAKLPDGTAVIITPNSGTDKCSATTVAIADKNKAVTVTSSSHDPASSLVTRLQHPSTVSVLNVVGSDKRSVITLRPAENRLQLFGGRGAAVVTARPRLTLSSVPNSVSLESPSGLRRIVHITPPSASTGRVRLPAVSLIRPTATTAGCSAGSNTTTTRPIILRKNQQSASDVVVRPCIQSPASSILRVMNSSLPESSALTVVSSPRTLSRREAIAAGWYTGSGLDDDGVQSDIQLTTSADESAAGARYAVRHIVPMDIDCSEHLSDVSDNDNSQQDELKHCPSDALCNDTDALTAEAELQANGDDRIVVIDNETQMKVIEIFPDDADTASDEDEEVDVKPAMMQMKAERNPLNDEFSRQCSSVSTETAVSDAELSTSNRDNFVVLAEWSQDESSTAATPDKPLTDSTGHRIRRRKRKAKKYSWWYKHRRSSSVTIYKARRTGGRPRTAEEIYGIVDSFVSLPVLRLARPSVDIRNWWRYVCCYKNQIQRCRCASLPRATRSRQSLTTQTSTSIDRDGVTVADGSKIQELVEMKGLIQPSLMASDCTVMPVQLSGPTSVDGVTPLQVRQPDGKLVSVVARRTTPGWTSVDAKKNKYLLIKMNSGSFLVPVNSLAGASTAAGPTSTTEAPPTPPSPPTSSVKVKSDSAVVSDTSGHQERIQQLKEQLRQQEELLQNIRSQRSSNEVFEMHKFDKDSTV